MVVVQQSERLAESLSNTLKRNKLLGRERPELYFKCVDITLLITEWCSLKAHSLEGLKKCCKLGIKMDIAFQIARSAQVILQGP